MRTDNITAERLELRARQLSEARTAAENNLAIHGRAVSKKRNELEALTGAYRTVEERALRELRTDSVSSGKGALERLISCELRHKQRLAKEKEDLTQLDQLNNGLSQRVASLNRSIEITEGAIKDKRAATFMARSERQNEEVGQLGGLAAHLRPETQATSKIGSEISPLEAQPEIRGARAICSLEQSGESSTKAISESTLLQSSDLMPVLGDLGEIISSRPNSADSKIGDNLLSTTVSNPSQGSGQSFADPGSSAGTLREPPRSQGGNQLQAVIKENSEHSFALQLEKLGIAVHEGENGAVYVELSGRDQRERRAIWSARGELERELRDAGVPLKRIKVVRYE